MLVARRAILRNSRAICARRAYASAPEPDYDLENYPKLPNVSRQYLSPYGWQDPQDRRNFGETLHEQDELYSMWGPDIPAVPPETGLAHFGLAVLGFVGLGLVAKYVIAPEPPMLRRHYPFDGLSKELGGIDANKARSQDESDAE